MIVPGCIKEKMSSFFLLIHSGENKKNKKNIDQKSKITVCECGEFNDLYC